MVMVGDEAVSVQYTSYVVPRCFIAHNRPGVVSEESVFVRTSESEEKITVRKVTRSIACPRKTRIHPGFESMFPV